jgi:heterodisulfide reductase subunit C
MLISMNLKSLILVLLELSMKKEVLLKPKKEDLKFIEENGVLFVIVNSMKNQHKLLVNKWNSITENWLVISMKMEYALNLMDPIIVLLKIHQLIIKDWNVKEMKKN